MREENFTHDYYYGYQGDKPEAAPVALVLAVLLCVIAVMI